MYVCMYELSLSLTHTNIYVIYIYIYIYIHHVVCTYKEEKVRKQPRNCVPTYFTKLIR